MGWGFLASPGMLWDMRCVRWASELAFIPVCLFLLRFALIKFLALLVAEVSFKMLWRSDGFIESLENY